MISRKTATRAIAGLVAASTVAVSLSACAKNEDTNYNAPAPVGNADFYWHRVESPGNYSALISTCEGPDGARVQDGIYESRDGGFWVVAGDPSCAGASDVDPNANNG
jgi:hypothetical protein